MKLKLFVLALLLFATSANAQSSDILVNMVPPNPAPYEETTITLKSYVYNLDTVQISWSVDGKTGASGVGKKSFTTAAPAAGRESFITALVSLPDGPKEIKAVLRPSVMVLLWQAEDSYVPPFYKGKALPTPDSEIKVVAMPEIRSGAGNVPAQNMTYYWKKDYTNNVDGSGYGKSFFVYTNDYLEDTSTVSVTASTTDQKYSSGASVTIATTTPKIVFYKNNNQLGTIWQNSLPDSYRIQNSEIVEAAPYFLSPKELLHPLLVWKWYINDSPVNLTGARKNIMPLQVAEGAHGASILRLNIENRGKIFQAAEKEINVEF